MKKNFLILIILLISISLYAQLRKQKETYIILTAVEKYPKKLTNTNYWIIPIDLIQRNTIIMKPLFLDTISYNIINYKKDTIPYIRNVFIENVEYKALINSIISIIHQNSILVEKVNKKWEHHPLNIDTTFGENIELSFYAIPVRGYFEKKQIHCSNGIADSSYCVASLIPISSIEYIPNFWNTKLGKFILVADFSYVDFSSSVPDIYKDTRFKKIIPRTIIFF